MLLVYFPHRIRKKKKDKTMEFLKYPSVVKKLRPPLGSAREVEWVATEKVHGANFQLDYNHKTLQTSACRRNGKINEGESFFNYKTVVWTQIPHLMELIHELGTDVSFKVYGELYGGGYAKEKQSEKWSFEGMVQSEVLYSHGYDFVVFDIFAEGRWLDYDKVVELCKKCEFNVVPELCRGTYEEVMNFNTAKLLTKIPKFDDLEDIEGNYMEGKVVRPVQEPQRSIESTWPSQTSGIRQIYKLVNDRFFEKKHNKPQKTQKTQKVIDDELQVDIDKITPYITINRFNNVRSKELPIESKKEISKYIDLMIEDIKKEMKQDNIEVNNPLAFRKVKRNVAELISDPIKVLVEFNQIC